MKELEQKYFNNQQSFREWLEKNHDTYNGIWLLFYKKHVDIEGISYKEALEEALCFGWIDSIVKRIDDDRYVRKFTPRTNISNWSDVNKKTVLELIEKKRMTEAGLKKIDIYLETGEVNWKTTGSKSNSRNAAEVPDFILKKFAENEPALTNFNNLAPSHKRNYVLWITDAKREETIQKRLQESIDRLNENKTLGMK